MQNTFTFLVVFTFLLHNAKYAKYYVPNCLKKIENLFLRIWRHIVTYLDMVFEAKHTVPSFWPKKSQKNVFLSVNQTLLKLQKSGVYKTPCSGQNNPCTLVILDPINAELNFLIKFLIEKMCSCLVFPEISFF